MRSFSIKIFWVNLLIAIAYTSFSYMLAYFSGQNDPVGMAFRFLIFSFIHFIIIFVICLTGPLQENRKQLLLLYNMLSFILINSCLFMIDSHIYHLVFY